MLIGRNQQKSRVTGIVSVVPAPPPTPQLGQRLRSAAAYLHQSSQLDREETESPAQLCQ